jgi:putative membrane protein
MADRGFAAPDARERLAEAVKDVEGRTSAEIVIAVRRQSGDYGAADLRFAALVAFFTLLTVHLLPHAFDDAAFVVDPTVFFLLALLLSSRLPPLRRLFTGRQRRAENVRGAALAAFVDLGVGRLPHRNGILVYASQLERAAEVVPDIGIPVAAAGTAWGDALRSLGAAMAKGPDLDAFDTAVRRLGPALARVLPRRDGDVNELPDDASVE